MTHYQEYTLFLPPNCPTKWDHLRGPESRGRGPEAAGLRKTLASGSGSRRRRS